MKISLFEDEYKFTKSVFSRVPPNKITDDADNVYALKNRWEFALMANEAVPV